MPRPQAGKAAWCIFGEARECGSIVSVQRTFVRARGHMIKGSIKNFHLIPKGTKKPLKGSNIVKSSLLIHPPKYKTRIDKKVQEGMWSREDGVYLFYSLCSLLSPKN